MRLIEYEKTKMKIAFFDDVPSSLFASDPHLNTCRKPRRYARTRMASASGSAHVPCGADRKRYIIHAHAQIAVPRKQGACTVDAACCSLCVCADPELCAYCLTPYLPRLDSASYTTFVALHLISCESFVLGLCLRWGTVTSIFARGSGRVG